MGYRTVKLRPLSSCPVQCRRPHHQPGCLKTWKPPRCRKTMRWKAVYHTLCFHMTSKPPCFWTRRSWDMARGVTYLFSSDKLKSRTLLLPPVRPRPPPGAPKPTLVGGPGPRPLGRRAHASPGSRPLSSPWSVSHRAGPKGFAPSLRTRPLPGWGPSPHLCLTPVPNLSREAGSSVDPGRARPGHLSKPS